MPKKRFNWDSLSRKWVLAGFVTGDGYFIPIRSKYPYHLTIVNCPQCVFQKTLNGFKTK